MVFSSKLFEKHLWESDILSKGAGSWPGSLLKMSLFHRRFFKHFASKNQLPTWFLHKWDIGWKWVKFRHYLILSSGSQMEICPFWKNGWKYKNMSVSYFFSILLLGNTISSDRSIPMPCTGKQFIPVINNNAIWWLIDSWWKNIDRKPKLL